MALLILHYKTQGRFIHIETTIYVQRGIHDTNMKFKERHFTDEILLRQ